MPGARRRAALVRRHHRLRQRRPPALPRGDRHRRRSAERHGDPWPDSRPALPDAHGPLASHRHRMTRAQALLGARIAFVVLAAGFAWWGFGGRWAEIGDAARAVGPVRM